MLIALADDIILFSPLMPSAAAAMMLPLDA